MNCSLVAAEEAAAAAAAYGGKQRRGSVRKGRIWHLSRSLDFSAEVTDDVPAEPADTDTDSETQTETANATKAEDEAEETAEDPGCPSRPNIIRCAAANLDTNNNNKLERVELQSAIDELPWLARGVLKIIGSVDKIMAKCDADGDDTISIDCDTETTKDKCLATCNVL